MKLYNETFGSASDEMKSIRFSQLISSNEVGFHR